MRSLLAAALTAALLTGGVAVAPTTAPADAAPRTSVTVAKIPTKTAPYRGKVTVRPVVKKTGNAQVVTKTLTVKTRAKKPRTVARNAASVRLAKGSYTVTSRATYKTFTLRTTSGRTTKVWSRTQVKTRTQTLVVKEKARPSRTSPVSTWNCPAWAPVKGNISSRGEKIYHLPGGRWYKRTAPEECFTSAAAARKAGYRASKNG